MLRFLSPVFITTMTTIVAQLFAQSAVAQTAAAPAQPGGLEMFLPFIVIFGIFYFLIIRPQSKRQKQHQTYLSALKRGDEVVTTSGILGVIEGITDTHITLEIANNVKIKILKNYIAGSAKPAKEG